MNEALATSPSHGARAPRAPRPLGLLRALTLPLAALLLTVSVACDTSCRQACKKLVNECGSTQEGYGVDQCELDCQTFEARMVDVPSLEADAQAFQENLNCIDAAECPALVDPEDPDYPACYDPAAYPF